MKKLLVMVGLALAAWLFWRKGGSDAMASETPAGDAKLYNPATLSAAQRSMADLIIAEAERAGLDPAFMVALAVTESSLRPDVEGDDGTSFGLFQLRLSTARDWQKDVDAEGLKDPTTNATIAMLEMKRLQRTFPGHTLADYAEAWTLGGTGRFKRGRRNAQKVVNLQTAADKIELAMNLNEVANA